MVRRSRPKKLWRSFGGFAFRLPAFRKVAEHLPSRNLSLHAGNPTLKSKLYEEREDDAGCSGLGDAWRAYLPGTPPRLADALTQLRKFRRNSGTGSELVRPSPIAPGHSLGWVGGCTSSSSHHLLVRLAQPRPPPLPLPAGRTWASEPRSTSKTGPKNPGWEGPAASLARGRCSTRSSRRAWARGLRTPGHLPDRA